MNKQLAARNTARADRNDANEMLALEEARRAGVTPAQRVRAQMDADETPYLEPVHWNARQDAIGAAPDADGAE